MVNDYISNLYTGLVHGYSGVSRYKVEEEKLNSLESAKDLIAYIVTLGLENMRRVGIIKEYKDVVDEERSDVRGRINVNKTLSKMSMLRGKVVCTYQILTENIEFNQYIKSITGNMTKDEDIEYSIRHNLDVRRQSIFGGVVTNNNVSIRDIRYNKISSRYKQLIELLNTYDKYSDIEESILAYKIFTRDISKVMRSICSNNEFDVKVYNDIIKLSNMGITDGEHSEYRYENLVNVRGNNGKKQELFMFCYFSHKIEDDVFLERQVLTELAEQAKEIESEDNIKTACTVVYILTDKGRYTVKESQTYVIDEMFITTTIIDIKESYRFLEKKVKRIVTQDILN